MECADRLLHRLLVLRGVAGNAAVLYTALWVLNPFVFVISTRGNAESLVAVLILATLYFLHRKRILLSAICFGAAVHLKTYPIIYAWPIFFFINDDYTGKTQPRRPSFMASFVTRSRLQFASASAGTFLALCGLFFAL